MAQTYKVKIVLVDDHVVVRQGLKALLGAESDFEVVGEAGNGYDAVELAMKTTPDVVVMDLALPQLNGLDATRQILRRVPATKILVLTSYGDDECVQQMMHAGASGFLIKQTAANELIPAIREVRRGNAFFSPAIARRLRDKSRELFSGSGRKNSRELTGRETEVLKLVAQGFSNRETAEHLGISIKTVEKHRQCIMDKLNLHEAAALTRYAISRGLVESHLPAAAI
jgi:DNA-binding NarL/FixJ family response regulator